MTLRAYVFTKLQTVQDVVKQRSKTPSFRTLFDSQHLKGCQTLPKSAQQHFYHIFHHSEKN